ncbi:hypothetical protein Tco_0044924 [Tanacetum coccineum]
MVEPIIYENMKIAQFQSNLSITSNNMKIDLSKEFLVELRKNMYHRTHNEDVVDHIAKVLKMIDLIYVPDVDSHQLRMKVFPLSLADDANEWWISKGEGKITTWEELVEIFFCRFYPESYDGEDEMLDEGENLRIDPLEFLSNVNTSFKNHKKVDGRTKKLIFHSWMNGNWNKRYVDNNISCNNERKESKYENPSNTATDSFFKAYDVRDIEKENGRKQTKRKDNDKDNKKPNKRRCKAEKFEAIQYSIGPNKEYIAIRSYGYDIWERNEDNLSIIYQDILQRKDEGWKMTRIIQQITFLIPLDSWKSRLLVYRLPLRELAIASLMVFYKVEVDNIPCNSKMDNDSEQEADDDMGYDPSNVAFIEWGDDKVELTNEESFDDEDDIAEKDDGYCNGGNLPGTYIIENQLHYQNYEWYEALEDSKLKDEALRNKAIMEGFIKEDDDKSRYEQKRRWNTYTNYNDTYEINHENNKREELFEIQELPVCNIRRYMMIKYSFNNDEEFVAVKEDEYDDLTMTRRDACLPRNLSDYEQRMDDD